jgi:hypothetical protein
MDMDKNMEERILDKLDKIDDRLNDMDKTLVRNTTSLEEHMKRSDALEKLINAQSDAMRPVEDHVRHMQGAGKLIVWASVVLGIVAAIFKFNS